MPEPALDEPKENNLTCTAQDIIFHIDRDDLDEALPIRIDYLETENGFGFPFASNLTAVSYHPTLKL